MSTENATQTPAADGATEVFDFAKWKAEQDQAQAESQGAVATKAPAAVPAAAEAPKPGQPAAKAAAATVTDPEDEAEGDDYAGMPKGVKRQLRQARRERDQALGRVQAYEAMIAAGLTPKQAMAQQQAAADPEEDAQATPEPLRAAFASDAEYAAAVAKWETARLFNEQAVADQIKRGEEAQFAAWTSEKEAAQAKFEEDVKLYDNWDDVAIKMKSIPFNAAEQATLVALIALTTERAAIMMHLSDHPEQLKALMALPPERQPAAFYRLEGKVSGTTPKKAVAADPAKPAAAAPAKPARPSTAAADAAKAAPSETVRSQGGQTASAEPSMLLADGTINPVWKARENEKDGLRR